MNALRQYESDLRENALHEAGHTLVSFITAIRVESVTISAVEGEYRGLCVRHTAPGLPDPADWPNRSWYECRDLLTVLAGPISVYHHRGEKPTPSPKDANDARQALAGVARLLPEATEQARGALLGQMGVISRAVVTDPAAWRAIEVLADALMHFKTLTAPMINVVLHDVLPPAERTRLAGIAFQFDNQGNPT